MQLFAVVLGVWREYGGCGFVWVELEVIFSGPLIDLVKVWLKVGLGCLVVCVGCCDVDVIGVCSKFGVWGWWRQVRGV